MGLVCCCRHPFISFNDTTNAPASFGHLLCVFLLTVRPLSRLKSQRNERAQPWIAPERAALAEQVRAGPLSGAPSDN
jgi:hypothetical protein